MKTPLSLLVVGSLVACIHAGPPSEKDPAPDDVKQCGLEYESVFGSRRAEQNYFACTTKSTTTNSDFYAFDVFYEGTISVQWSSPPPCAVYDSTQKAQFSIGQIQHPRNSTLTRADWESNPFHFDIQTANSTANCPAGAADCPPKFEALSASSRFWWSQYWTTSATKITNGYSISGNLTTTKVNGGSNGYTVWTRNCADDDAYGNWIVTARDAISMTGSVTPESAEIAFTVGSVFTSYSSSGSPLAVQPTFKFSGKVMQGAKLVTTGDVPGTEGDALLPEGESVEDKMEKIKKWLYPVIGGVVGVLALSVILCCCCCYRRRARKQTQVVMVSNKPNDAPPAYVQQPVQLQYTQSGRYEPYSGAQGTYQQH